MFHGMNGGGFMWLEWIFLLVMFAVIIWVVLTTINKNKNSGQIIQSNETPLEIIKKRYAKGELTKEQFEEMKNLLK